MGKISNHQVVRSYGAMPDTTRAAPTITTRTRRYRLVIGSYFVPNRKPTLIGMETRSMPFTLTSVTLLSRKMRVLPLPRSEEHTSELQSQSNLVCRLLLEKKKKKQLNISSYTQEH